MVSMVAYVPCAISCTGQLNLTKLQKVLCTLMQCLEKLQLVQNTMALLLQLRQL